MKFELSLPQELERAKQERWPIIMPLGPLEYHGWHCVYGTDVLIPLGILERFETFGCIHKSGGRILSNMSK